MKPGVDHVGSKPSPLLRFRSNGVCAGSVATGEPAHAGKHATLLLESRNERVVVCVDALLRHRSQNRTPHLRPVPNSRPVSSERPDPDSTNLNHRLPLLAVHRTTRSTPPACKSELPSETRFRHSGYLVSLHPQVQCEWFDEGGERPFEKLEDRDGVEEGDSGEYFSSEDDWKLRWKETRHGSAG
jgi:hypothetical protein